jgi:CRISPR-associated protein Csb2
MLAIEIELLTGRYAATAHHDRRSAEWPPHPARFFSALVAALHDGETVDPLERESLLWLERQSPPALDVSVPSSPGDWQRRVLDVFVPVNDVSLISDADREMVAAENALSVADSPSKLKVGRSTLDKATKRVAAVLGTPSGTSSRTDLDAAAALFPEGRTRQVRTFPVVVPPQSHFRFVWREEPPAPVRQALGQLCRRVARLGHSSSLVRCAVVSDATPTLQPDADGDLVLRTVCPGQLDSLEAAFRKHQGIDGRVLPSIPTRYSSVLRQRQLPEPGEGQFSEDWIVFERVGGGRPLASRGPELAMALRRALIEQHGSETLPEWISGHQTDGRPSNVSHLAFVPLPFIGDPHADGSVQGCALVLPRGTTGAERDVLLRLVASWEAARGDFGQHPESVESPIMSLANADRLLPVRVRRREFSPKTSLMVRTWCRPSTRFVTATPIALDRHPGNLRSNREGTSQRAAIEAQISIAKACVSIGLPSPTAVEISLAPLLTGAQSVQAFSPWPRRADLARRAKVHAEIRFPIPVRGPVVLGAGRFFGLGLCLPVSDGEWR